MMDNRERTLWSEQFRATPDSLGVIIQRIMGETAGAWMVTPTPAPKEQPSGKGGQHTNDGGSFAKRQQRKNRRGKGRQAKAKGSQKGALALTNGSDDDATITYTNQCAPWNKGQCSNNFICPSRKAHKCNYVIKSTKRQCNGNHRAINCPNKGK